MAAGFLPGASTMGDEDDRPCVQKTRIHLLTLITLLLTLGIGALFARAVWTLKDEHWAATRRINTSLALTLDRSIARAIDAYDLSLQGVVTGLSDPEIMGLPARQRHTALFDQSLRQREAAGVLVLNSRGDVVFDSGGVEPRPANLADRGYFQALQNGTHTGLYIDLPVRSRITGKHMLPMARAYFHADGRFAGVVVGGLRIGYFSELLSSLDLGEHSGVTLFRSDGTVVARFPYHENDVGRSIAGSDNLRRIQAERSGSFFGTSVLDGFERFYAFRQVGDYPLILSVAQSTQAVLAEWRRSAAVLGGFALLLVMTGVVLATLLSRELRRRQQVTIQLQEAERDMRTIMDNLPSMIGYWDARLCNRFANHAYLDWFGMTPEQLRGKHISELLGAELYTKNRPYLEQALQGHAQLFERTIIDPTGVARHSIASYTPDFDGDVVRGIFVQVTDISERKRMENELFQEKELMRLTLHSIGDAVICTDAQGLVTYLNPVARRMTGWQAFDAAGHDVDEVAPLYLANGQQTQPSPLRVALATQAACGPTRGVVLRRKDGQRFEVEESASPIIDRQRQLTGAVMVLHDVTETMAMAERMAHLAQYDPLTDLPNRVLLQDRAQHALAVARRDGKGLAVMYLDLDGFKQVNDTLGHDAGDQLLVQFARRLVAAMRQSDTVCRQGGDEFVVLFPALATPAQIRTVVRKVLAVVQQPFVLQGQELRIGLSGGLALFPQHGDSYDALARHADTAMYAAKRAGRMQVRCYVGPDAEPEWVDPGDVQGSAPSDL